MFWAEDRALFVAAVIIYGCGALHSIFLWRQGFRRDHWINASLLALALAFHTSALAARGYGISRCPVNNLYEAVVFMGWAMSATCLGISLWPKLRLLGAFASPILLAMGIFALMPELDKVSAKPVAAQAWRSIHAGLVLLSCGAFGLSAASGLMYLTQEHNLKFNKLRAITAIMPPIQRLEFTVQISVLVAFVLLTLGLASGILWLVIGKTDHPRRMDPFSLWSVGVWLFYVLLLLMHWKYAVRGRRFVRAAVGGFLFIVLTFWGFYLLSPIHNP